MRKIIILTGFTSFLLVFNIVLFGQMSDYKLSASSGSFTANSGSATAVNVVEADDAVSNGIPIGFAFKFDTTNYSYVKAGSNGWLSFDTTIAPSAFLNRTNGLNANPTVRPVVAPLWDNLDGASGAASYELTGSAPNRIFTFEWKNWKWDLNATAAVISFQVKLYETSNKIEFVYKQEAGTLVNNSSGASIGLSAKSTGTGNFVSLNNSGTAPTISTTTETISIGVKPATGQIYAFEKGGCSPPTAIDAINITKTEAEITFTQPKHIGDSFYIEYGAVGFTRGSGSWIVDTIVSGTNTKTLFGLVSGTVYDYYVGTICQTGVDSIENTEGNRFVTIATAPYSTNFDVVDANQTSKMLGNGWNMLESTGPLWSGDTATGSDQKTTLTGPFYDNTSFNSAGGGFLYLESSTGLLSIPDTIESPWIDISLLNTPYLDFYYHMYGANMGSLYTAIVDSATGNLVMLDTISGQQHTAGNLAWTKRTVSLSAYKGNSKVKLVFLGKKNGNKSDMAIDDVSVYDKASWDLKVETFVSPQGVCSDSNATITLAIKNNTTNGINFATDSCVVSVTTSGATSLMFSKTLKTDSLGPLDTMHITFTSTYNKAIIGTHNFLGKVVIVDDPAATNDTLGMILSVDTATKATLSSLPNLCANSNAVTIMGTGSPVGGTSVYSGNGVSGSTFNPTSAGKGSHILKLVYTDAHGCIDSTTTSVAVDSVPTVTFSALPTLCKGGASITLTQGSPSGGTYSGNNVSAGKYNPSAFGGDSLQYMFADGNGCKDSTKTFVQVDSVASVSFPAFSNRCLNAGSLTLNTATPVGGVYLGAQVSSGVYTPTSVGTDSIKYVLTGTGNCKDSATQTITIDSVPTVTFASISSVCVGSASFTLTGGSPSGGTYSGNRVTSGSYNPSVVGTDTITYSFTDGNSCTATAKSFVVVNALPTVTFSSLSSVCVGSASFSLTGGAPSGGTYSGNNVSSGSYNPVSAGTDTLKYVYTNSNFCTDSATSVMTVNALPTITFPAFSNRCLNAGSFTLNTATPTGGTYSGTNVSSGVYAPTSAGIDTITYSFTDGNSCTNTAKQTITIDSVPTVTFATLTSVCVGSGLVTLTGGLPIGGTYSGNRVSGGLYNPSSAGNDTLKYTFTDGNSCSDSAFSVMNVDTIPNVTLGTFNSICKGAKALTLSSGLPTGGIYFGKNVALNLFVPFTAGIDTIRYTFKDANNCSDTVTQTIVVDTIPIVSFASLVNVCANTPTFVLTGGMPIGGAYSGSNVSSGMYTATSIGVDSVMYSFTDSNTCTGSAYSTIKVDSVPVVSLNLGFTQTCENARKTPLVGGLPMGGTYKGLNVSGTDFDPSLGATGTSIVRYVFVDGLNCSDSTQAVVTIDSIQKVTLASFGAICKLSNARVLTAGNPVGGVYSGTNVNSTTSEFDPSGAAVGMNAISYTFTTPKGCKDSAQGNIVVEKNPSFSLGNDTSICGNSILTLDIGIPFMKYNWSTGDTGRSIKIQKSAIVIAQLTDTSTMANCTFSDTIRVDYDEICVGLKEVFANASIKYFPNPSDGKFFIEFQNIDLESIEIQIVSLVGAEVYREEIRMENGAYQGIIELENLPSGVYLMNLISDKGMVSKRISIR